MIPHLMCLFYGHAPINWDKPTPLPPTTGGFIIIAPEYYKPAFTFSGKHSGGKDISLELEFCRRYKNVYTIKSNGN